MSFSSVWVMAAQEVVVIQCLFVQVQVDHQAGEEEPKDDVGGEDVPLVVVVQAFRRACLTKVCGQRGDHEGGPA